MNALLRSVVLGVMLGLAFLLGGSWWMRRATIPHEPRPFPDQSGVAQALDPGDSTDAPRTHVDPHVQTPTTIDGRSTPIRPARHHSATHATLIGTAAVGQASALRIESVADKATVPTYVIPIDTANRDIVLFSNTPVLTYSDRSIDQGDSVTDSANGNQPLEVSTSSGNVMLKQPLSPGVHVLTVAHDGKSVSPSPITVRVPESAQVLPAPTITHYAPGRSTPLLKRPNEGSLPLYGAKPYLRLRGEFLAEGFEIRVFHEVEKTIRPVTPISRSRPAGSFGLWEIELELPSSLPPGGKFRIVQQSSSQVSQSSSVDYEIKTAVTFASPPIIESITVANAAESQKAGIYFLNNSTANLQLRLVGVPQDSNDIALHAFLDSSNQPHATTLVKSDMKEWSLDNLPDGRHTLRLGLQHGNESTTTGPEVTYVLRRQGPTVTAIVPENFGIAPGVRAFKVVFNPENPVPTLVAGNIEVLGSNGSGQFDRGTETKPTINGVPTYDEATNSFLIQLTNVLPDVYQLTLKGGIVDIFGNPLEGTPGKPGTPFVKVLGKTPTVEPSYEARGIVATSGNYVPYQEFTKPRNQRDGFNPSDKVETRVARLYYFRDAHRVAQIVNRKVKSHNRPGVDTARQLADRARNVAEQRATIRQQAERAAIDKAQKTRARENELQNTENSRQTTLNLIRELRLTPSDDAEMDKENLKSLEASLKAFDAQVESLTKQVQDLRDEENIANEAVQKAEAEERLARDEQFRREVAAARADPDTYAEGSPDSDDPVEQVSVSVIGEGLIQLRGPIKGINIIRTMIDQIDAPVGQVRVAVHTVQLNGERANRMEEVAAASQRFIDQSRFLTLQSGELLRRSVVQVASQRADEARGLYPGETQEERDHRYLHGFFGRDFVEELRAMDSEFLRTGNKLLSLHSMDTTSLSSALTLMALARNDARMEILQQFEELCQTELPRAEQSFFEQSMNCGLKKHHLGHLCKPPDFVSLAGNARFESLRGFFAADVGHQDTMTPLQREFLRLAQILKSRLVVEMELKQRVTERAIIEERGGDRNKEREEALAKERLANDQLASFDATRRAQQSNVIALAQTFQSIARRQVNASKSLEAKLDAQADTIMLSFIKDRGLAPGQPSYDQVVKSLQQALRQRYPNAEDAATAVMNVYGGLPGSPNANQGKSTPPKVLKVHVREANGRENMTRMLFSRENGEVVSSSDKLTDASPTSTNNDNSAECNCDLNLAIEKWRDSLPPIIAAARAIDEYVHLSDESGRDYVRELESLRDVDKSQYTFILGLWTQTYEIIDKLLKRNQRVQDEAERIAKSLKDMVGAMTGSDPDFDEISAISSGLVATARSVVRGDSPLGRTLFPQLDEFEIAIQKLLVANVNLQFARNDAERARRPLDHKKFLDMLIDETEDKYIELLEGTRAHTANIDNYIKRLTTALDDDFNTQFYNPTFRLVRESSARRYYNVQFGQIETTSILANNRSFAKVSPAASMEFDLPQRDILLTEAITGAKALINDVGALANDPTFLAMAKLNAGQSSATPPPGSTGGFSVVRNVLPGLGGDTTEQVLAQNANGGQQFGSNLENLIPDPAIYKFETGTGYEIRPVIQPDGQAVVFGFHYLYTTQIREPVRADEKHLGRVKRHFIDTDVQLSNFELREVSRYIVALKAARTSRGVPLLEDIPVAGALFRPAPSDESSLQQNVVLAQATIFPTLFDLMGLRWAPVVADLDPLRLQNDEFTVRGRNRMLRNRVYDITSEKVDDFLRFTPGQRRTDLYRTQESIPAQHPNGYEGPGLNQQDSSLQEGYSPQRTYRDQQFAPPGSREGSPLMPGRSGYPAAQPGQPPLQEALPRTPDPEPIRDSLSPRGGGAPGSPTGGVDGRQSSLRRMPQVTPAGGYYAPSDGTAGYSPTPTFNVSGPRPIGR